MKYFKYSDEELDILKSKDQKLKKVIDKLGRIYRKINPDLFSQLINSIVSQQVSTKAAATVWHRLKELIDITPKNILMQDKSSLQKCGLSNRKVMYIVGAAEMFAKKKLDINILTSLPDEEFIKELTKIKGVGIWTAEMLLIFSLNRMNVFSYHDLGIKRGLKIIYQVDEVSKDLFASYQKTYHPYCSIASLYLWEIASNPY